MVGFLGSEVVLSPVVFGCLPLSPVVSLHVGGAGSDMQHEVCGTKYAYNSNNNNNYYYQ